MRLRFQPRNRRREQGLITVIVFALIVLLGIYLAVNMRVLAALKGEIQLIDQSRTVSEPGDAGTEP